MHSSCLAKQSQLKELFKPCQTAEENYLKIIELGKQLPSYPEELKIPEKKVLGCQSLVYLHSTPKNEKVHFLMSSDALISSGLAALLLFVYNNESPETILKCPPSYLEELGIPTSLTPGRANGLASMHLRMKQDALDALLQKT